MQAKFNQDAIDMLPIVKKEIDNSGAIESNQMRCYTIDACMRTNTPIVKIGDLELEKFQAELFNHFKSRGWVVK